MKYIKEYENTIFRKGDYIVFNWNIPDGNTNEIVIKSNKPYKLIRVEGDNGIIICDDDRECGVDLNDPTKRKISKEEAKLLINAEKYNL